jgi:hypothetical protein
MATDKTFNIVGVSKLGGEYKVRFATDIMRIKVLAKHGHEDIRLAELATAVSKYEAVRQLQSMDEFADAAAQSAIAEYLDEKAPKTPAKVPAAKAKTPAKTATKAPVKSTKATRESAALKQAAAVALADAEDAPF